MRHPPTAATTAREEALGLLRGHAEALWVQSRPPHAGPDRPARQHIFLSRHYLSYRHHPPRLTVDGTMRWAWPQEGEGGWWQAWEVPVRLLEGEAPALHPPPPAEGEAPDPLAALRGRAVASRLPLLLDGSAGEGANLRLCEPLALRPRADGQPGVEALLCLRLWWQHSAPRRGKVYLRLRLDAAGGLSAFRLCSGKDAQGEVDLASVDARLLPPASAHPLRPEEAAAVLASAHAASGEAGGGVALRRLERGLVGLSADGDLVAYAATTASGEEEWRRLVLLVPRAHLPDRRRALAFLRAWAEVMLIQPGVGPLPRGERWLQAVELLSRPHLHTEAEFRQALRHGFLARPRPSIPPGGGEELSSAPSR